MPCMDPRDSPSYREPRTVYTSGIDPALFQKAKDHAHHLESILCAVFTYLDTIGIVEEVVATASRHGRVDVMAFWEAHTKDDRARLAKELHKYSIDEQAVLRELLGGL